VTQINAFFLSIGKIAMLKKEPKTRRPQRDQAVKAGPDRDQVS
jgi:hypothetical protein